MTEVAVARTKPRVRIPIALIWIVATALIAFVPIASLQPYWVRQILLVSIMALLVSGLNLSLGWAGELNMGLPAMYAVGAYITAWFASQVIDDILICFVLSVLGAVATGLMAGAPGLRLGGWMLAVCTFLLVTLIPSALQIIPVSVLGGTSGYAGIPLPKIFGFAINTPGFFVTVIVVTSIWFAVYRNAVKSRFGNSLLVLQHGEVLAPSLGISRYRLKLTTYAFAALPVGLAGTLFAFTDQYISPDSLGLNLILNLLVASIIAGRRSIYVIFIGAAFVQFVSTVSSNFGEYGEVAFGAFLVIGGLVFGGGISGLIATLIRRFRRRPAAARLPLTVGGSQTEIPPVPGRDLRVEHVSKVFGGVKAVSDVSLTARAGQITALIGPNGSGKTTTLNMINGFQKPTTGTVVLGERDITGLSAMKVARAGVARTFQTPLVPGDLSVVQVVESSRIASHHTTLVSTIFRTPRYRRAIAADRAEAMLWLEVLGLAAIADEPAAEMSLGTRRMIELARALCSRPAVMLLDEVASGLDSDEVKELAGVLRRVRSAGATVILVEHNFSLVQSLADHVVVLAEGAVLTDGDAQTVAEHPDVLERFLGTGAGISGTTMASSQQARVSRADADGMVGQP